MAKSFSLRNFSFCLGICFLLLSIFSPFLCAAQNVTSIVRNSIRCINSTYVYRKCQEQYTTSNNGLDAFCSTPCLAETQLILGCVDGILSNFNFYSPATINALNAAVLTFCNSRLRGNASSPASPPTLALPPRSVPSPTQSTPSPSPSKAPSPSPSKAPPPSPSKAPSPLPSKAPSPSPSKAPSPSPSRAPSPSPSKAPSPSPSAATSHGGNRLRSHLLVPGLWAAGSLMFMLLS